MPLEIAFIPVAEEKAAAFEAAASRALADVFPEADGYVRGELRRGVERPGSYALLLEWRTVQDHTEGFVGSQLFDRWLELTNGLIDGDPVVEHWTVVQA
jgi:heme-degrading monooxygenase HmoA